MMGSIGDHVKRKEFLTVLRKAIQGKITIYYAFLIFYGLFYPEGESQNAN